MYHVGNSGVPDHGLLGWAAIGGVAGVVAGTLSPAGRGPKAVARGAGLYGAIGAAAGVMWWLLQRNSQEAV